MDHVKVKNIFYIKIGPLFMFMTAPQKCFKAGKSENLKLSIDILLQNPTMCIACHKKYFYPYKEKTHKIRFWLSTRQIFFSISPPRAPPIAMRLHVKY